jgi:hypothetical protein
MQRVRLLIARATPWLITFAAVAATKLPRLNAWEWW